MWGFVRRWRTRTTSQTQMLLALLTLKPAVAISKYGLTSLFLNLSYTNFSRELYLLMQFALGPSAWDEIHHAILKASKLLHGMMNCLLQICQLDKQTSLTIELKGGLLEQFTHEMEPFLRKQVQPDVDHVTVFPFRMRDKLNMKLCRENLKPDKM
ncbi:hypothetical protein Bca4012_083487 [Brassica carinata]